MGSEEAETRRAISRGRLVISVTCSVHGGTRGYTNLAVRKLNGAIELDPHAIGTCVITINEDSAFVLRDALVEWLG